MKRTYQQGILMTLMCTAWLSVMAQTLPSSIPVTVNCATGQSLNRTLAKLDKHVAATVSVTGTCTEYVQVIGFENLTLKGMPGAALLQPTTGAGNLFNSLLLIESSRSITVQGFNIQADTTTIDAVGVGHGSSDVRLRNLQIEGGILGIIVFENSQVLVAHVSAKDPGYTPLGIFDSSDAHVEHCSFENSTVGSWHAGIALGASHVTLFDTTIKNMQVGISAGSGSIVDVLAYDTYTPFGGPSDVTILSPAGTNFNGVSLSEGASLNISTAKLVISSPGQPWGGSTGGILVSDGSTLNAFNPNNLLITGSHGQGIAVLNNSHATLAGSTITGGGHGGLVVANLSSIDINGGSGTQTLVGGNGVDVFCDASSMITGSVNLAGVATAQCTNLLGLTTLP